MNKENPWRTCSSRIVYENPWLRLREDQVIRPDGRPGIYSVVEKCAATAVVALDADQNVWLVGQYRYATAEYSWELIEGGADRGESPLQAAQRELREEAGLEAASWQQLGPEVHLSNCISSECGYFFLARDLKTVPRAPEGTEVLVLRQLHISEALRLVRSGGIKDAMTIIGLLRAEQYI